jgi:hypothetical protein
LFSRYATGGEQHLDGIEVLSIGEWHHVAVVLGSGGGILYIDGKPVNANPGMTLRPADLGTTTNNYVGRSQFAADTYLDASIDDFRVYNRALSPTEIQTLFAWTGSWAGSEPFGRVPGSDRRRLSHERRGRLEFPFGGTWVAMTSDAVGVYRLPRRLTEKLVCGTRCGLR